MPLATGGILFWAPRHSWQPTASTGAGGPHPFEHSRVLVDKLDLGPSAQSILGREVVHHPLFYLLALKELADPQISQGGH